MFKVYKDLLVNKDLKVTQVMQVLLEKKVLMLLL